MAFTEEELAEFRRHDAEQAARDAAYAAKRAAEEAIRFKAGWWAVDRYTGKVEPVPGYQNTTANVDEPWRVESHAYRQGLSRTVRLINSAEELDKFRREIEG